MRLVLFIFALLTMGAVECIDAQQIVQAEYFFDTDPGVGNGIGISPGSIDLTNAELDVSIAGLTEGLHRVFVRVKDSEGAWSSAIGKAFYIQESVPLSEQPAPTELVEGEYFFDKDPGVGNGISISPGSIDLTDTELDVSIAGLTEGLHKVYVRVKDNDGGWSSAIGKAFYIQGPVSLPQQPAPTQLIAAEYFIDEDPGFGQGNAIPFDAAHFLNLEFEIGPSKLSFDTHQLFLRVKDDLGQWSLVARAEFIFEDKESQTITFTDVQNLTYGDVSTLEASSNAETEITFESSDETIATVVSGKLTIVGVGEVTIDAIASGNDNFVKTVERQELKTAKADLEITADDKSREYGADNPLLTFSATGFVLGDDWSDIILPEISTEADNRSIVGDYPILLSGGSADYYNITTTDGMLTVDRAVLTASADDKSKTYGEENPIFTISYAGFVNGDDATDITEPSASTVADIGSDVGAYDISLSGGVATNYSITKNAGTLTINRAALTATADDKSKTYGEANPDLTISYTGFVNGDNATDITEPSASTVADADSNVGVYDISLSGGNATNYSITKNAGTLTISKAVLTATADDKSKTYGEANPDLTISYTGFVNGDNATDITEPSASTVADAGSDAGAYDISLSGGNATNYTITNNNGTLTINKSELTATADDKSKTYGEANPDLTISYSGFVNGDDATDITEPSASTTADASTGAGSVPITLTGGNANNYTLTTHDGTLNINKAALTAIADDAQINKGDNLPDFTISYSGFVNGDDETSLASAPTATTSATATSDRGEYQINISGGESDNYELTLVNGILTITGPVYALPESIDFGSVMLGDAPQQTVSIENTGDGNLDITGISLPEAYTVDRSTMTVSAGSITGLQLTFTPTAAQVYAGTIQIESNNGIDEISLMGQGEVVTGLDDDILDLNEVELFPNPATNWLTIDMSQAQVDRAELKLLDANGQPVWNGFKSAEKHIIGLNTSLYANGVYLLTVSSKAGTIVKKVLIQR